MTKYYIRISDEKPVDWGSGLYFEVEANDEEDGFYVLSSHEYSTLLNTWNDVRNNYTKNITNDVLSVLSNTSVVNAENTSKLAKVGDSNTYYTYNSLKSKLDALESDKANATALDSLNSTIGIKANSSDLDATNKSIADIRNDLKFTKLAPTVSSEVELWVNRYLVYFRIEREIEGTYYEGTNWWQPLYPEKIPEKYCPMGRVIMHNHNTDYMIMVTTNGKIHRKYLGNKSVEDYISCSAMWIRNDAIDYTGLESNQNDS